MNPENIETELPTTNINVKTAQNSKLQTGKDFRYKPQYLGLMRNIAGVLYAFGILSGIITALVFVLFMFSSLKETSTFLWILAAFGGVLQCFVIYCVLNALADIAENMVEVGNYSKELRAEKNRIQN